MPSKTRGCNLCQLFWGCIINTEKCANKLATRFLSEASLSLEIDNFEDGILLNLYARGTSDCVYGFIELVRLKANERKQLEVLEKRLVERFSPGTMFDDLRKLVDERILPWMKDCYEHRENHSWCGLSGDATIYPTRLIDIGEAEDDAIRLVETDFKSVTNPYLILSYCWGQSNESAKTTRNNLESRLCGFSTTMLPKTIRDSIMLTRMMGFRYLWVDAICIVQATEDDLGDFKLEAVRMRDYYANAQCCISASLARDSSEGFLTERPLAKCPVPRIALEFGLSTTSQSLFVELKERDGDLRRVLLKSPLMERGWS
ncbi:tol protein [Colletotrichum asianum]